MGKAMMRYKIIHYDHVTQQMIDDCLESSFESLRVSKDNNTILKWDGAMPLSLYGKGKEVKKIFNELKKPEWDEQ